MGIGYVNYYLNTWSGAIEAKPTETNRNIMDMCLRLGLDYSISCHVLDPPDECVKDAAKFARDSGGKVKFRGVVFDELWHARFLNYYDLPDYKTPLAKTKSFGEAYQATLQGYAKLKGKFPALDAPAVTATLEITAHNGIDKLAKANIMIVSFEDDPFAVSSVLCNGVSVKIITAYHGER